MSVHRQLAKVIAANANASMHRIAVYQPPKRNWAFRKYRELIEPTIFTYFKAPMRRFQYARQLKGYRDHGIMADDTYIDFVPVNARALSLMPHDLFDARYRRLMRATELFMKHLHLPEARRGTVVLLAVFIHSSPCIS
eukprot:Filipodium_phascolosomae@DN2554_c0_g1_i1.p1